MKNKEKYETRMEITHEIFDDVIKDISYKENGNYIVINIDDDRRIKLSICDTSRSDLYDSIALSLVSKTCGIIDSIIVNFNSVFENPNDLTHPNKLNKHIWKNNGYYEWYGLPNDSDYAVLKKCLTDYIDTWK